ncbi:mPR-like GPCR protein [Sphaerosporella brunnea]|uniref:MPR-like GPCR protein n=1 Tax=Sphaerosporella brunnea TaxID=1250544 RepID=A0A5J5EQU0_9PEZI|nr:mPR-like GPCR protein [Sphaerosporella brunnea]
MTSHTLTQRKKRTAAMPTASAPPPRQPQRLLSYAELAPWQQDNEYLLHGYRAESRSVSLCLRSWSYLHNESVNIYSHLVPAVFALFFEVASERGLFQRWYPEATGRDRFVLTFFLLSAALCLGTSAMYHTLLSHSEHVAHVWVRLDFLGIIALIEGFFVSGIYVAFYCEPRLQRIYWTMITTLGIFSAILIVNPRFQGRRWRSFRLLTFVTTGLSAFAPIAHGLKLFGWEEMFKQSGLPYYLFEGLLICIGAYCYNGHIPEKFRPGAFDIWGASHQLFHLLVVAAVGVHLAAIRSAFEFKYVNKTCAA